MATLYSSRPKSASKVECTHGKPLMQVKYKQRSGSRSVVNDLSYQNQPLQINQSRANPESNKKTPKDSSRQKANAQSRYHSNQKRQSKTSQNKRRSNSVIIQPSDHKKFDQLKDEQFRKTSCVLMKHNFKHHDTDLCVCEYCTCGRHLCKLHGVAPNMSKISSYDRDYPKKKSDKAPVVYAKQYGKLDGPHLEPNSTYLKDFPSKANDDLSRPHPQDLLKTGGPCPNLTSYRAEFPGYKGDNQYVKPTDKHRREKFPLRGRSTYDQAFLGEQGKRPDWEVYDNLKTGNGWFGGSTYQNFYKAPKRQNYPDHIKPQQKRELNPDYQRQYETTYGNQFLKPPSGVCPAKIELQSKRKGLYRDSKIKFLENSDYKSMSPDFKSYSANRCH